MERQELLSMQVGCQFKVTFAWRVGTGFIRTPPCLLPWQATCQRAAKATTSFDASNHLRVQKASSWTGNLGVAASRIDASASPKRDRDTVVLLRVRVP